MTYKLLDFCSFDKFNEKQFKEGILRVNLNSWREFRTIVQIFNKNTDYIWRGQRCNPEEIKTGNKDWKLRSSFDRNPLEKGQNREEKLNNILGMLKQRLNDLPIVLGANSLNNDEIWIIGQHYGLLTPLLDWTKNPFKAAYFAFYKTCISDQTQNRIVYALNRVVQRLILIEKDANKKVFSRERKVKFDFDISNFTLEHNQRFINQESAFTKSFKGSDVKTIVEEFWKKDNKEKKNIKGKLSLLKY